MNKAIRVWFSLGAVVVGLAAGSAQADEGRGFPRQTHVELIRVRHNDESPGRREYRELEAARGRFYRAHHSTAECRRFDRWYGVRRAALDRQFGVHRTW